MELGAFSISLSVKDIKASKSFYEKLGFEVFGGDMAQNWLIMKNGDHVIGLFQGMFEKNSLTFNPGWDQNAKTLAEFATFEQLALHFQQQGLAIQKAGEASFIITDPDGNPILIDQHV